MSTVQDEIFGDAPREQRFNPESDFYTFALDPYCDRLIQFTAFKQMGYPVDLIRIKVDELPEEWFQDDILAWERDHIPVWIRPVVTIPAFEDFIEDPDVPGDLIRSDNAELDELLCEHPFSLVTRVETSDVHMLAHDLGRVEKGEITPLSIEGRQTQTFDLLASCFMAALDRHTDRKAQGFPFWQDKTWSAVSHDDYYRYWMLAQRGFRPVSPEQLGSIAMDYYALVEEVKPEFAKFKGAMPDSSTPNL